MVSQTASASSLAKYAEHWLSPGAEQNLKHAHDAVEVPVSLLVTHARAYRNLAPKIDR